MKNHFIKEIEEQPEALFQTLNYYKADPGKSELRKIAELWKSGKFTRVVLTGMGSSFFIAGAGAIFLNSQNIPAFAVNAGELLHYQLSLASEDTLFICISQSGESFEIVKILEGLPTGITVVAVTNEQKSTLAQKSHVCLLSKAGKEEMTSTKTFIATYLVIYLMANALAGSSSEKSFSLIDKVIDVISDILKHRNVWLKDAVKMVAHTPFVQLVARGSVFAAAQQSALMIMEATRNPASALTGGEFRHGPMEMVKEGFRAIIWAPGGSTYEQSINCAKDVLKFGGKVLLLTDKDLTLKSDNLFVIRIPAISENLFAITSLIPLQLIVNQWAEEENNEPGNFTRGAKVTTIE